MRKYVLRKERAKDAWTWSIKGTPSRLEKYRAFLGGQGVIVESLPMRDLVDKTKRLIVTVKPAGETPAPGSVKPAGEHQ